MRRKIANAIDDQLYQQIKSLAVKDGKPINQIIEESLREYLQRRFF